MALAIDISTSSSSAGAQTSLTSASFTTTSSNEIILALISNGSPTGLAVSGGGLTWNQLENHTVGNADNSVIYWAFSSGILTNQTVKVSATNSQQWTLSVITLSGVDTGAAGANAIGNHSSTDGTGATAQITNTTTRNGSWVFGVIAVNGNVTLIAGSGQTILQQVQDSGNVSQQGTLKQNATTPTSGTSVTIGVTNSADFNASWVEIKAALASSTSSNWPILSNNKFWGLRIT